LIRWRIQFDPDTAIRSLNHSIRPRSSGRFSAGRPALLELRLAAEAMTPSTTLSAIRDKALK
jgi:hypothetical protein